MVSPIKTFCFFLPLSLLHAGSATGSALPAAVTANALQRDTTGNLYVAGSIVPSLPKSNADTGDVYVAKLSADGATVIWSTILSGSSFDSASALAISSAGSVYVTGTTSSPNFPVSASALQTTGEASAPHAFVASLDSNGNPQYATFLGGSVGTASYDIALSATGAVIVTGFADSGFVTTANTAPFKSSSFLIGTDANLTHLLFASTVGGQRLALDATGNIYVTGTTANPSAGPMTQGAFQTSFLLHGCGGTIQVGIGCSYQYIVKVNATATNLIYATFLDGSYGSSPSRLIVDAQGNAIVGGSTYSSDYPTTAGAFQTMYIAANPSPPQPAGPHPEVFPPPQTGYISKVNAQGSGLIFSTFLGGSVTDAVGDLAVGSDGYLYVSGYAESADFPGMFDTPAQCLPEFFLTRLTTDGAALTHTVSFTNTLLCLSCSIANPTAKLILDAQNHPMILAGSRVLAMVNVNAGVPPVACVLDAADMQQISSIVPGQLLSIFGSAFSGAGSSETTVPSNGVLPTVVDGTSFTVNGVPAPILYFSRQQINVQAPFELAGTSTAQINLLYAGNINNTVALPVASSSPSLFLASLAYPICNGFGATFGASQSPLAFNADGSANSCGNPATLGSAITVYLNGLGAVSPSELTGTISESPVPLAVALVSSGIQNITATSVPGSIDGLWQAKIKLPATGGASVVLALSAGGVQLREQQAVIWTKAASGQ